MDPHTSCLFPLTNATYILSCHNIHPAHMSPSAFLFLLSRVSRKKCTNSSKGLFCSWPCGVLVHREVLRFGSRRHLWLCGIPLLSCFTQGLALEIPMPMPSQHHKSSRTIPGIFQAQMANFSFCVLYIYTVSRKGSFSKF